MHRQHHRAGQPLGPRGRQKGDAEEPQHYAASLSRSGIGTKSHLVTDGICVLGAHIIGQSTVDVSAEVEAALRDVRLGVHTVDTSPKSP